MIIKAENYQPDERIFALFLSRSKAGKSAAAASFPRPYHQLDFDGRFDGVWGALKPQGWLDPTGVSFERYFTKAGYNPLNATLHRWSMEIMAGQFPYKTIELASISSFMQALINSSHELQSGKKIGDLRMSGPGDYNFEVTGTRQLIDNFASLPCHVIVSGHIIDKYGKVKTGKPGEEYAQNEVIGEKVNLRDQPGENLLSNFSNVFRFDREVINGEMHYFVDFNSDVAGNSFNIPPGRFDITRKAFYPFLQDLIKQIKEGTFKNPNEHKPFQFGKN